VCDCVVQDICRLRYCDSRWCVCNECGRELPHDHGTGPPPPCPPCPRVHQSLLEFYRGLSLVFATFTLPLTPPSKKPCMSTPSYYSPPTAPVHHHPVHCVSVRPCTGCRCAYRRRGSLHGVCVFRLSLTRVTNPTHDHPILIPSCGAPWYCRVRRDCRIFPKLWVRQRVW
jgi:hypothetical protein